uniref:Uncharacterized protein n=1 Tax=Glossina austeni TaxID=7395 RepID=A0A1A9UZS4_GLOAU
MQSEEEEEEEDEEAIAIMQKNLFDRVTYLGHWYPIFGTMILFQMLHVENPIYHFHRHFAQTRSRHIGNGENDDTVDDDYDNRIYYLLCGFGNLSGQAFVVIPSNK